MLSQSFQVSPRYLIAFIPTVKRTHIRNDNKQPHFKVKRNYFKKYIFPSTVIEL